MVTVDKDEDGLEDTWSGNAWGPLPFGRKGRVHVWYALRHNFDTADHSKFNPQ
jgi:hypothetical protein